MLHVEDLDKIVLDSEAARKSDKAFFISGYVGPDMIQKLTTLKKKKQLIVVYGMYGQEKISQVLHNKLVQLDKSSRKLEIYYSTVPVHSKLYCWLSNDKIEEILIGSANFTASGLKRNYKECLHEVLPDSFDKYNEYQKYIINNWVRCTDPKIKYTETTKLDLQDSNSQPDINGGICRMSLLDGNGKVPLKSGLNWGFQKGHPTKSRQEAYIYIKADYRNSFPTLFPPKKYVNGKNCPTVIGKKAKQNDDIELLWDDGTSMAGLMEGSLKAKSNVVYPLQISSSKNKTILGRYLRYRIIKQLIKNNYKGASKNKDLLDDGKSFKINLKMLQAYGRTHIDVSLIGEGIYYLDFSV